MEQLDGAALVAEFVARAFDEPLAPPPPKERKPRTRETDVWVQLKTPEARSAYARQIAAKRTKAPAQRRRGVPNGWNRKGAEKARETAFREAYDIARKLRTSNLPVTSAAIERAADLLEIARGPGGLAARRKAAESALRLLKIDLDIGL